jgi:hypothetical protein
VAVIALFIALGGSVYAANKISGKTIKKGSEPGNRIKKNTITGKQVKESTLGNVPNANALGGTAAADFAPISYASVNSSGSVNASRSKGITSANVTHPGSGGVYCFHGFSSVPKNIQAIADNAVANYATVVTDPSIFAGICVSVPNTQFSINIVAPGGASFTPGAFYLLIVP